MKSRHGYRRYVISYALGALLILAAGFLFYQTQKNSLRAVVENELLSIAQLKAEEIVNWRVDRLRKAAELMDNRDCVTDFARWLDRGCPQGGDPFVDRINTLYKHRQCTNILVIDPRGTVRYRTDMRHDSVATLQTAVIDSAVRARAAVLSEVHRSSESLSPHIDVIIPLFRADGGAAAHVGTLVLRYDLSKTLFAAIQRWPVPSASAEVMLVRRDGDSVLYLNELRHINVTALHLRTPMDDAGRPAVHAARGEEGYFEGRDYRGVAVVSAVKRVAETPWYIVAKIDSDEAFAALRIRTFMTLGIVAVCLLAIVAFAAFGWQRNQKHHYQQVLALEKESRQSEQRYRATLMCVGDGVIATDARGMIDIMNPVAEQLTGWRQSDARGKPLETVLRLINEETQAVTENPVARVLREGVVVGLANHTLLVDASGAERPIADSAAPIRSDDGAITGVVLVFRDQTMERTVHNALAESERRFRSLFENMNEGVALHNLEFDDAGGAVNYRVVGCNRRYEQILNIRKENILGKLATDAYGVADAPFLAEYAQTALTGRTTILKVYFAPMDAHFEISVAPWADRGFATIFTDETAQVRSRQELIDSQALYDDLVSSQPTGIYRIRTRPRDERLKDPSAAFTLEYVSPRFCELLGIAREQLVGNPRMLVSRVHPDDARAFILANERTAVENAPFCWEGRFIIEGKIRWMHFESIPRIQGGGDTVWTGSLLDITDRMDAELELRELKDDLEKRVAARTAELQASNKELEAFTYSVSHDLRAPLRAINSFAGIVVEDYGAKIDDEGRRQLAVIGDEALRMGKLIDDLLKFSRLGRQAMMCTDIRMNALVREVIEALGAHEKDRAIDLRLGDLPDAHADPALLRVVWTNILDNALKFTRREETGVIEVSGCVVDGECEYRVKDNGAGFDMKYTDKLFEVFQRLHKQTEYEGTGVGLALVQRIVHRHGGRIWAESQPGAGAVFSFTIPGRGGEQ